MGDTFQSIVDRDASRHDAPHLAQHVVDWLVAEGIVLAEAEPGWALGDHPAHPPGPHWHQAVENARWGAPEGVAVYTEHHIFFSNFAEATGVTCPRCENTVEAEDDAWSLFDGVIDAWYKTGEADVDCPACAQTVPLSDWNWSDDHLAFVCLGLEFWNWPWLSEPFRARIAELLGGHRTAYLSGKI